MKPTKLLIVISIFVVTNILIGCGYTVLRDFEREAIQAEWTAIDSIHYIPDLRIANVEYEHRYHPGSPNVIDPIDSRGFHTVTFHLTIENVGNADFHAPYTVVIKKDRQPGEPYTLYGMAFNKSSDTMRVGDKQEIELVDQYPYSKSSYNFVIVTNPIIQHNVVEELKNPPRIPLTRESRYDNNDARIIIPALKELLHGAQQQ